MLNVILTLIWSNMIMFGLDAHSSESGMGYIHLGAIAWGVAMCAIHLHTLFLQVRNKMF